MNVSLLFPPNIRDLEPTAGLPCLAAFLKHAGHDVVQRDLNIETYDYLLSDVHLTGISRIILAKLDSLEQEAAGSSGNPDEAKESRKKILNDILKIIPETAADIGSAVSILRDPNTFYDFESYTFAVKTLHRGRRIINSTLEPDIFPVNKTNWKEFSSWRLTDIIRGLEKPGEDNSIIQYIKEIAVDSILNGNPDLIGISITYSSQIYYGLLIAKLVKERDASLPIFCGGSVTSEMVEFINTCPELFDIIDGVVIGEGEHAIVQLASACDKHNRVTDDVLAGITNLMYRTGRNEVKMNEIRTTKNLSVFPTPDYDGICFEKYLLPHKVGLLASSRGCYWKKCAFCSAPSGLGRYDYSERKIEDVLEDIIQLKTRHGLEMFFFTDECFTLKRLGRLADMLISNGVDILWGTETRLDKALDEELCNKLRKSGCAFLVFGLESASQRILDLMEKGINIGDVKGILQSCYKADISTFLMTMVNFPSETLREARETVDFLREVRPIIGSAGISNFMLLKGCKVERNPLRYGIDKIYYPPAGCLSFDFKYSMESGDTVDSFVSKYYSVVRDYFSTYNKDSFSFSFMHIVLYMMKFGNTLYHTLYS